METIQIRRNLLTLDEARKRLRISRSGLYRLFERGELSSVHVGARHLIFAHVLDAYLAKLEGITDDQAG